MEKEEYFRTFLVSLLLLSAMMYVTPAFVPTSMEVSVAGYGHRLLVLINNAESSSALADYQVRLDLDSTSFPFIEAMDNGADIRFTDEDGITQLDYWIEKWDKAGQSGIVWVKVPFIPSMGEKVIYLYYGKPSDISASDGEATFVFFDDFGEGSSKWLLNDGASIKDDKLNLQGNTIAQSNVALPSGNLAVFAKTWGEGKLILCYVDAFTSQGFGISKESNDMFKGYMVSDAVLEWIWGAAGPPKDFVPYILENSRLINSDYNFGVAMESDYTIRAAGGSWSVSRSDFVIKLRSLVGIHYVKYVAVRKYNGFRKDPTANVHIPCTGDLNDDGRIDVRDVGPVALAFGSYPYHVRWNPMADLNQDRRVDIKDIAIVARNFGKTIPPP